MSCADQANFDVQSGMIDEAKWTILMVWMKSRRPRSVPLSEQALCCLCDMRQLTGPTGFVFQPSTPPDAQ
jgi:hypothetical protein